MPIFLYTRKKRSQPSTPEDEKGKSKKRGKVSGKFGPVLSRSFTHLLSKDIRPKRRQKKSLWRGQCRRACTNKFITNTLLTVLIKNS